jgi:hypothetical protein
MACGIMGCILTSRETNILVEGDTAYDTVFTMFYTLYHIFKQESVQGRGTIKGRDMIKCRGIIQGRGTIKGRGNYICCTC